MHFMCSEKTLWYKPQHGIKLTEKKILWNYWPLYDEEREKAGAPRNQKMLIFLMNVSDAQIIARSFILSDLKKKKKEK